MYKILIYDASGEIYGTIEATNDSWKFSRQTGNAGIFDKEYASSIVNTMKSAFPMMNIIMIEM